MRRLSLWRRVVSRNTNGLVFRHTPPCRLSEFGRLMEGLRAALAERGLLKLLSGTSVVDILEPDDIVLVEIGAGLYLD
jgi:hypothetical protein